jgi:hypothetical protein
LGIQAAYHETSGEDFTDEVASLAKSLDVSTLIIGGYENTSILDRVFIQALDETLARIEVPVLICQ